MAGIIVIFFLKDKKLSPNTAQISEHINSTNYKIHYYDQRITIRVNIISNKGDNNTISYPQLYCIKIIYKRTYLMEKVKQLQGKCRHLL